MFAAFAETFSEGQVLFRDVEVLARPALFPRSLRVERALFVAEVVCPLFARAPPGLFVSQLFVEGCKPCSALLALQRCLSSARFEVG